LIEPKMDWRASALFGVAVQLLRSYDMFPFTLAASRKWKSK